MRKSTFHFYVWWWASGLLLAPFLMQAQPIGAQKAATSIEQNFGQQEISSKQATNAYPPAFRQLEAMLAGK